MARNEEMPTELIRKKSKKRIEVVKKSDYDELQKLYDEVVAIGYDLLETIDEQDRQITWLTQENERLRYQLYNHQDSKPNTGKRFDGATISFNPKTRSLGIGLRFKD